jgi:hypothetical protein
MAASRPFLLFAELAALARLIHCFSINTKRLRRFVLIEKQAVSFVKGKS